jgi:PAS domain S-box-containing protein
MQSDLTPAALINADRKQIEMMILSGAHRNVEKKYFAPPAVKTNVFVLLSTSLAATLLAAVLHITAPHLVIATLVVAVASTIVSFWIITAKILPVLDASGRTLADKGHDLKNYDQIPSFVDTVLTAKDELEGGKTLIVDASPDALCCLDVDLNIKSLNNSLCSFLGYIPEELVDLPFTKLVLPDDLERFTQACIQAKANEPVERLDLRVSGRHSQAIDLRLTVDWSGSNELYFIRAQDVSYEKRLERARSEYISTISHDIKIPLTSVLLSLESLTHGDKPVNKQRDTLLRVESGIENLIGLIDELLEYEKSATSGRLPLRYSSAVLSELVDDAVESVAAQAEAKGIQLELEGGDISVQLDKSKIERVIVNLLSNAIKFTPPGGRVRVSTARVNDMVEIKVLDNGPGIPQQYKHLIFERYERIPDTQDVEGSGLGLAICKAIVEAHRGLIGVTARKEGGSEFWFNLPLRSE